MKRLTLLFILMAIVSSAAYPAHAVIKDSALSKPKPFQSEALERFFQRRWVVLLAQGPDYIPESCRSAIPEHAGDADQEKMVGDAYFAIKSLIAPLSSHLSGQVTLDDNALYDIVRDAKRAQFLLEQTTISYRAASFLPLIKWDKDPTLQIVMEFLSALGIDYITKRTSMAGFKGFSPLDIRLLNATKLYAQRAISAFETIVGLSESHKVKTWLKRDFLSSAYNNFGSAHAYLGDVDAAKIAFQQALAYNPDNIIAQSNILDLRRLSAFINVGDPLSRRP